MTPWPPLPTSAALLSGFLLCSCATASTVDRPAMSPRQVIRSISAVDGHEVTVRGSLSFGSHARQLWQSERARQEGDPEGCITLVNTEAFAPVLRQRHGHNLTVVGTARSDVTSGYVDYGACDEVGLEIIRIMG